MVKDPSGGQPLLCGVENLIACLFQSTQPSFKLQIQQILTSLESVPEKADKMLSIFDDLKNEICRCLELKDTNRSNQEEIMYEYVQLRANLCVAYMLVECRADKVVETLPRVYKKRRDGYITVLKPLLEGCLPLEREVVKQVDKQLSDFYSAQVEETQQRLTHLNEIAQNVYQEPEEIEALRKQLGTPFFNAVRQWRDDISTIFQNLLSQKGATLSLDSLIKQELEERIALFEPLAQKK
jgi:hypothetical protein